MAWFKGGLSKRSQPTEPESQVVTATLYTGDVPLEVVGESFYQDALWEIVGGPSPNYTQEQVIAALVPQFENPWDNNSISVQIDGKVVGHLPRETAERYRPGILKAMRDRNSAVALHGRVCGGGSRSDRQGMLGVFLDHDPADFGLPSIDPSPRMHAAGHLRTGLTEAGYLGVDMSWVSSLPEADRSASTMLRDLLKSERDVVARHFMYAELERRLYHSREVYTEAIGEFDAACDAHDVEMDKIRPALIEKFHGVPVLDTYRQMCVRQSKAGQWQEVERWADRGLALYDHAAIREEAVEDLTKRLNRARAKCSSSSKSG